MNDSSQTVLAYAAGLFDGEGSVSIRKRRPGLTHGTVAPVFCLLVRLSSTHEPVVHFLLDHFGGRAQPGTTSAGNAVWQWQLDSQRGATFLTSIRPWMITKADDADLAVAFQAEVNRHRRGLPLTAEEVASREAFRIQLMSRRGTPGPQAKAA